MGPMVVRKTTVSIRTSERTPQQYTEAEEHKDNIPVRENGPHRETESTLVYGNGPHRGTNTTVISYEKDRIEKRGQQYSYMR